MDTSNRVNSVAIIDEDKVIAEYLLDVSENNSQKLLYLVNQILRDSELMIKKIDGLAVTVGPGSFTTLRVGIATAKGLAIGARKPLCGIPTLDVLAANICATALICPILDAKARWIYGAVYQYNQSDFQLKKVTADFLLPLEELFKKITAPTVFLGSAALIHQGLIEKELGKNAFFAPQKFSLIRAANVATLALRKLRAGEVPELSDVKPIYLERKGV